MDNTRTTIYDDMAPPPRGIRNSPKASMIKNFVKTKEVVPSYTRGKLIPWEHRLISVGVGAPWRAIDANYNKCSHHVTDNMSPHTEDAENNKLPTQSKPDVQETSYNLARYQYNGNKSIEITFTDDKHRFPTVIYKQLLR